MWSETFTDSYGWKWSLRQQSGPEATPVQLLVTPPGWPQDVTPGLEPFSYGIAQEDLPELANIVRRAEAHLRGLKRGSEDEAREVLR